MSFFRAYVLPMWISSSIYILRIGLELYKASFFFNLSRVIGTIMTSMILSMDWSNML